MKNQIKNSTEFLIKGKIILYPTDTIWGIGCDATNKNAIQHVFKLKQRNESKSLIILVSSIEMLQNYIQDIPQEIKNYLNKTSSPTTVIYNNPKNLPNNLIAQDNTIAIRIVKSGFAHKLIKEFNKPIVSTSANISNKETPIGFNDISLEIKNKVDYIVKVNNEQLVKKSSKIIRFAKNKIEVLRK